MMNLMTMIKLLSFRRNKVLYTGEIKCTFVIEYKSTEVENDMNVDVIG